MVTKKLNETVRDFYYRGLIDEELVTEAVEKILGGTCDKATKGVETTLRSRRGLKTWRKLQNSA